MGKQHLKRLAAPKSWPIARKKSVYITRPKPGAHQFRYCMPVSLVLSEILGLTQNKKEVKHVLENKSIMINEKTVRTVKSQFGYMDTLHIPSQNEAYRMLLSTRGKLSIIKIPESEAKTTLLRLQKKSTLGKDKIQLSFDNGATVIVKDAKDYKIGDSVVYDLTEKKITKQLPLTKGATCQVLSGRNAGLIGIVEDVVGNVVKIKADEISVETRKANTFVIGESKPYITVTEKEQK